MLTPFDVAVIVTVPAPTPVTFPPLTFAIFVLPEVHATASFPTVPLTVAVSCVLLPVPLA